MKKLDLSRSVYDLGTEYPEIIDIMDSLGFSEIKKAPIFNTVGRMMTIPRGAKMKGVPVEKIIAAFMEHGFEIAGEIPEFDSDGRPVSGQKAKETAPVHPAHHPAKAGAAPDEDALAKERVSQIKDFLRRLNEGDSLGAVRADFARSFKEVSSAEIMKAEQALMDEGMPLEEVQKLCDVHSALFHGATKAEMDAAAASSGSTHIPERDPSRLASVKGHPVYTFTKENEALKELLQEAKEKDAFNEDLGDTLEKIRGIVIHYAKKGDLLYPHLKVKYDISGPSNVMWTVDDEIRDEMSALSRISEHNSEWIRRVNDVLDRAEEMIYKETNILFPICDQNFTEEEWIQIYHDSKDYAICLGVENEIWEQAEQKASTWQTSAKPADYASSTSEGSGEKRSNPNDEIIMAGGHMTIGQLVAMLNTIPLEITFVDAENINRYFNEGPKVFKRAAMAIDREVFSCHPPKVEPIVRSIIDDFRNHRKDQVQIWMEKAGRTMLVTYMAVRGYEEEYIGTIELIQDMEFAKEHFLG